MSKTPSSSPEGRFFYDLTIDSEDEENKHGKKATSAARRIPMTTAVNNAKRQKLEIPAMTGRELRDTDWNFNSASSDSSQRRRESDGVEAFSPRSQPNSSNRGSASSSRESTQDDSDCEMLYSSPLKDKLFKQPSRISNINREFNSREALEQREENIELDELEHPDSEPIEIDSDDDDEVQFVGSNIRKRKRSSQDISNGEIQRVTASIGSMQLKEELAIAGPGKSACTRQLSSGSPGRKQSRVAVKPSKRNPEITFPFKELPSLKKGEMEVAKDMLAEVHEEDLNATTFLHIQKIILNQTTGEVTLRGHEMRRTRLMQGTLTKIKNELVRLLEVDEDDPRSELVQGMVEYDVDRVKRIRQFRLTNQQFQTSGDITFRNDPRYRGKAGADVAEYKGLLVCRQERLRKFPNAARRLSNSVNARWPTIYRYLSESDIPKNYDPADPAFLRNTWRKEETVPGGAFYPGCVPYNSGHYILGSNGEVYRMPSGQTPADIAKIKAGKLSVIDLDGDNSTPDFRRQSRAVSVVANSFSSAMRASSRVSIPFIPIPEDGRIDLRSSLKAGFPLRAGQGQMYTYGDAFCGAGGATRGAQMAGLKVTWGFDLDANACRSWQTNFPDAAIYEMAADQVCDAEKRKKISLQCDILHMSPPCQFFSPAHTIAGVNDEMNSAALMACDEVLKRAKPRLVTLEQTFGITQAGHILYFNTLINMFLRNGYSITYKVVRFEQWGLPQRRQRLIVIGAGPGEKLPDIPPPTHTKPPLGTSSRLRPFTSAGRLLTSIPEDALNHDVEAAKFSKRRDPWDASGILPRAMTTSGGQNHHPDGYRNLTLREYATLQGFPLSHRFEGKAIKRQIGNAVPPSMAKLLFTTARKALEKADGVQKFNDSMIEGREIIELD